MKSSAHGPSPPKLIVVSASTSDEESPSEEVLEGVRVNVNGKCRRLELSLPDDDVDNVVDRRRRVGSLVMDRSLLCFELGLGGTVGALLSGRSKV